MQAAFRAHNLCILSPVWGSYLMEAQAKLTGLAIVPLVRELFPLCRGVTLGHMLTNNGLRIGPS